MHWQKSVWSKIFSNDDADDFEDNLDENASDKHENDFMTELDEEDDVIATQVPEE